MEYLRIKGSPIPSFFCCLAVLMLCNSSSLSSQSLSCLNEINISLDHDCESIVEAEDILSHGNSTGPYTLMLTTASGTVIPGNMVNEDYLWTTLTAKVTDSPGNNCWGYINVEDKLAPSITCADVTIECYDMNNYEPTAIDGCSMATVSVLSQSMRAISCDDTFVKEVTQTYQATDTYGNTSSCSQTIMLKKFDMASIAWPDDFAIEFNTNLTCNDPINADGYPDISRTGVPTSNGVPIFPYTDLFCNISVEYRDVEVIAFGCARKIMRTWYVYEWSCNGSDDVNHVQLLEIEDTELPTITNCPASLIYDANSNGGCSREVELQLPTATDDCSGVLEIDVVYEGGFANNATQNPIVTLSGSSLVTYTVYDNCDNSASCSTLITIQDQISPTAACDQNSVVSLRADGTAVAFVGTFDDGSHDNCNIYKSLIKRTNNNCGCNRPTFEDLKFLGEHNGHLYYLSDRSTTGPWASSLATAHDGELVSFNTQAEADWVVSTALAVTDSIYIGLNNVNSTGQFLWPNHINPTYLNWAPNQVDSNGSPLVAGNYVILNENGEWEIVTGADGFRYLVEIPNTCGFSSRVNFCCDDVANPQEVILRVIDISGRINECVSTVTIQDKVAPVIVCPKDLTVDCNTAFDPSDSVHGVAQATDQCTSNISFSLVSNLDPTCKVGTIQKIWTAIDGNGSSSCTQTFNVTAVGGYDSSAIIWPIDFDVEGACNNSVFSPQNLSLERGFPRYTVGGCDNVTSNYQDDVYSFAGPGSDACAKIIRTWTVTDHCMPMLTGVNPRIHQQAIKINNSTAPTISNCTDLTVNTTNCNPANVSFSVTALDDCAPQNQVSGTLLLDKYGNNSVDLTLNSTGNVIHFTQTLPLGYHNAVISFDDRCGNTATCTKRIHVLNTTNPSISCKNSVSVNIQAMDVDSDPATPDLLMALISPSAFIASISNPCNFSLTSSFSLTDVNDQERMFTCADRGNSVSITVYITDSFGFSGTCTGSVIIQDNNNLCTMPPQDNVVNLTGCELISQTEVDCQSNETEISFQILASSTGCTTNSDYSYNVAIDYNSDNIVDVNQNGTWPLGYLYNESTPEGIHTITATITDACGATATCVKQIELNCKEENVGGNGTDISGCEPQVFLDQDCNLPVQFGNNVISNSCSIQGDYLIIARVDFHADGSIDIREDLLNSGVYTYNYPTPAGNHELELTITDACGIVTICTKEFTVVCANPVQGARISGIVYTEEQVAVEEVEVELEGAYAEVQMTKEDGVFAFPVMETGNDYRVSPYKDNDPLNGISTLDLIHIQRNILGIEPLDSPYKLIAADVDNSGAINGIDLVELRKLILGIYDHFPRNTSWKMVDASYIFPDVTNPFLNSYPEKYVINNFNEDMNIEFVGVKIGDVNNTVELNGRPVITKRSNNFYEISCKDQKLKAGSETELIFQASGANVHGAQLELSFDVDKVEILSIEALVHDMNDSNFNTNKFDEGRILMSWNSSNPITEDQQLFKVTLVPVVDANVHDVLELAQGLFKQEVYIENQIAELKLAFETDISNHETGVILYQNNPNPWSDFTDIKYYLPSDKDIVLSLYSINGRLIYQEQKLARKGMNKVVLSKDDLPNGGVFYYELQADNIRHVEKMVHID